MNINHRFNLLLIFFLILLSTINTSAQTEIARINLHPSVGYVQGIRQSSFDGGKLLLQFQGLKTHQYSVIENDQLKMSKRLSVKLLDEFVEAIHDGNSYSVFYRNTFQKTITNYQLDPGLPDTLVVPNKLKRKKKELALKAFFHSGEFIVSTYKKSPFTLFTYRYLPEGIFKPLIQEFKQSKKEKFWGFIDTEDDLIIIRVSRKNLTMHLYRYSIDKGFEKQSYDLKEIYTKAGIPRKKLFIFGANELNKSVSAHISGDDIYIDMDQLLGMYSIQNPGRRTNAGVLKVNWETQASKLFLFDSLQMKSPRNQSSLLHQNYYFKLLVNHKQLDLFIYDLVQDDIIRHYSSKGKQLVDITPDGGLFEKEHVIYLNIFDIRFKTKKKIEGKKLLRRLSGDVLYMEISSNNRQIELFITSEDLSGPQRTTSFSITLGKPYLDIIYDPTPTVDTRYQEAQLYFQKLSKENRVGRYLIYPFQDKVHLTYIDMKTNQCKILAF